MQKIGLLDDFSEKTRKSTLNLNFILCEIATNLWSICLFRTNTTLRIESETICVRSKKLHEKYYVIDQFDFPLQFPLIRRQFKRENPPEPTESTRKLGLRAPHQFLIRKLVFIFGLFPKLPPKLLQRRKFLLE